MKEVKFQEIADRNLELNYKKVNLILKSPSYFYLFLFIVLLLAIIMNYYILITLFKNKLGKIINLEQKTNENNQVIKSNINLSDEFFQISEVKEQIYNNNITFVKTLAGGKGMLGNALTILDNLINVCIRIKCQNIIVPGGLKDIIKNPIFYKDYYLTILPESYRNKTKIDIELKSKTIIDII